MIIRQHLGCTLWGNGVGPSGDKRDYEISGSGQYLGFEDLREADDKFCELTGLVPIENLLIKKPL